MLSSLQKPARWKIRTFNETVYKIMSQQGTWKQNKASWLKIWSKDSPSWYRAFHSITSHFYRKKNSIESWATSSSPSPLLPILFRSSLHNYSVKQLLVPCLNDQRICPVEARSCFACCLVVKAWATFSDDGGLKRVHADPMAWRHQHGGVGGGGGGRKGGGGVAFNEPARTPRTYVQGSSRNMLCRR